MPGAEPPAGPSAPPDRETFVAMTTAVGLPGWTRAVAERQWEEQVAAWRKERGV